MSRLNLSKYLGSSLLFVTATMVASNSVTHAATVPEVVINGVQNGQIVSANGLVQFTGVARDPEGIYRINAQLKHADREAYLLPNGKFVNKSRNIAVKFTPKVRQTQWATKQYQLPEGSYVFNLQVVDNAGTRTQVFQVPVGVGAVAAAAAGKNTAAAAPAATANATAPRVAINFPKNGSAVKGRAAFSGIARDDGQVVRVVATIMNAENGLFLNPNGRFGQRAELALQTSGGSNAQWSSPPVELPPGKYVLAVRGIDNSKAAGGWTQSNFTVVGANSNAAVAAKPAASNAPATNAPAIVATAPAATAAAPKGGTAANGMRYCSNAGQDADGDGFGWENKSSCVVAGSRADTHPNCASAGSDPDGDGYGWENERSCIVVAHCASANSDPDGDGFGWENEKSCVVLSTSGRFPKCASAGSDPDGDGYGWENNKTCLVN